MRQRLGGRRDSAAQIDNGSSPPADISPPPLGMSTSSSFRAKIYLIEETTGTLILFFSCLFRCPSTQKFSGSNFGHFPGDS